MLDPFWPPPQFLVESTRSTFDSLGFSTLPFHIHEVFVAYAGYQIIYSFIAPAVSARLVPKIYSSLPNGRRINWNVNVTSIIQSTFITILALWVIGTDKERKQMDWAGRIWGYTGAMGLVQAFAAGYFVWDLLVSVIHLKVLGAGSLAHAISALLVTSLGFRPFANYYGLNFILYEISTPFLNIHWFLDKLNMTGSRIQLYNGIALMATFFCSRVLWGNYQSFRIYSDVWTALKSPAINVDLANNPSVFAYRGVSGLDTTSNSHGMTLPTWLVLLYLGSNTVLNLLNIYWFMKMVKAMKKRFEPSREIKSE